MTNDSDSGKKLEASAVSVKIPPFWTDRPEIWFYTVEAQFKIAGITAEETKFNYLVAQLDPKFVENIWDIIKDTNPNKYTAAKERLTSIFKESENARIKRLLTGVELGDQKPSQLLRKMRTLCDHNDVSDKILRTLWLEKMPKTVQNILIVSDENLDKLTAMADKIVEMTPSMELASASQEATPHHELLSKISSLEQQIASLHMDRSRATARRPDQRNRSRSRSRKRFNPQGKLCFFHFRFGKKCFPEKCTPPCSWKESENSNQR